MHAVEKKVNASVYILIKRYTDSKGNTSEDGDPMQLLLYRRGENIFWPGLTKRNMTMDEYNALFADNEQFSLQLRQELIELGTKYGANVLDKTKLKHFKSFYRADFKVDKYTEYYEIDEEFVDLSNLTGKAKLFNFDDEGRELYKEFKELAF